jgi:hypothetical protein
VKDLLKIRLDVVFSCRCFSATDIFFEVLPDLILMEYVFCWFLDVCFRQKCHEPHVALVLILAFLVMSKKSWVKFP